MKKFRLQNKLLLFVTLLFACNNVDVKTSRVNELPYYNEATFTPIWLENDSKKVKDIHTIAPFRLLNQDGDTITEKTFEGKIYVTDFFFTSCPGICPKMTANMAVLQDEFSEFNDVLLLSHSVTPKTDSVPILKKYAENQKIISGKWHLATGSQEEIYNLGRLEYFVEEDLGLSKNTDEFLHTENFVLIDKNRHIRGIYNGLSKTSINQLIADVRTLRKEN
jgi:protein SCO1/2